MDNLQYDYIAHLSNLIKEKQETAKLMIDNESFEEARIVVSELAELSRYLQQWKNEMNKQPINETDVSVLRSIRPVRKSVQNMLEDEVLKTSKFENLLLKEMGTKSPYEMRINGGLRKEDRTKTITIINVKNRDVSNINADKKSGELKRGDFINKDTGFKINYGSVGINYTLAHANYNAKRHLPVEAQLAALYHMQELIENAVCFDSVVSEIGNNKTANTMFMHKLYGVFNYNNENYLSVLSIEESFFTDKNNVFSDTNSRLYNLKGIKIAPISLDLGVQSQGILPNGSRAEPIDANITIPQLYELVKTYDQSFFENPKAPGRTEREQEIKVQNEFSEAVLKLNELENSPTRKLKDISEWAVEVIEACENHAQERESDKSREVSR